MRWRKVVGFPRYLISDTGKVWDTEKLRFIGIYLNSWNYPYCCIVNSNGIRKGKMVHRLVAESFLGESLKGMQVNHKDGNKENNNVSNLEWVTPSGNLKHAYELGLRKPVSFKGESNPMSKLSAEDVTKIYNLRVSGITSTEISKMFGCSGGAISMIWNKKTWKSLTDRIDSDGN